MSDWRERIGLYLTEALRASLFALGPEIAKGATDLRLRVGQPPLLCGQADVRLASVPLSAVEVRMMVDAMLGHAAHARQEELRQGFVTLEGGFRAGLCGRAVVKEGRLFSLQDIAFVSIRIARDVPGAAAGLMPWIWQEDGPVSALIVSPPGLGKTTMLRDAAVSLSRRGLPVVVVDERSELAACVNGVPALDVGPNTDVLDGCPKAEGMRLALRGMSPKVIVTDEIGSEADTDAVLDAARCGVAVLTSAHGRSFTEMEGRPVLTKLLKARAFERIAVLDGRGRIGVVHGAGGEILA